jgi:hypothetical protein
MFAMVISSNHESFFADHSTIANNEQFVTKEKALF